MNKKRIFYWTLTLALIFMVGVSVSKLVSNHRETDKAVGFALTYVQQHYHQPDGLKVSGKCFPFFGSGMHEIILQDAENNPYYLYVKVGPHDSLTSIEDATSYMRNGDYQFGCKK